MAVRALLLIFPIFTLATLAAALPAQAQDVELQIGIIQRFGDRPRDTLTLKATPGDTLTVRIPEGNGQTKVVTTDSLKLETVPQALPQPRIDAKLIFSTHRSFESAEEQAQYWRSRGWGSACGTVSSWRLSVVTTLV